MIQKFSRFLPALPACLFLLLPQLFRGHISWAVGVLLAGGLILLFLPRFSSELTAQNPSNVPGQDLASPAASGDVPLSQPTGLAPLIRERLLHGYVLLALFLLAISSLPIGAWLSRPLLLPHSKANADAVVMLACGFMSAGAPDFGGYQRFVHAARLFREKRAPVLVLSTSEIAKNGHRQKYWVASLSWLCHLHEPGVEVLDRGRDTRSEARIIAEHLLPRGLKRILLVTNGPHILRSVRAFEKAGFEVLPAPVQTAATIREADDGLGLFHFAVHEWLGLLLYWLRGDIDFPFRHWTW
jgi:uncharacterized SAM-binding protein YcdF (DUF218 family)